MTQEQNHKAAHYANMLKELFHNNMATMDSKGRLTYIDSSDPETYMNALNQHRWNLRTVLVDGKELSTVFLMMKSGGCFFESALINSNSNGHIGVIDRHHTYKEAQHYHKKAVEHYNHQKVFGKKNKRPNKETGVREYTFRSKPNKLQCESYLEKEAKHRTIKMKRRMKKLLAKLNSKQN
ncbi:hypothetical protein [Photobacterium damselae]|uniref:hypothetical protein n=1 Tax=Photobacterium damselae TaxID=38293 RepID=UPI004068D24A